MYIDSIFLTQDVLLWTFDCWILFKVNVLAHILRTWTFRDCWVKDGQGSKLNRVFSKNPHMKSIHQLIKVWCNLYELNWDILKNLLYNLRWEWSRHPVWRWWRGLRFVQSIRRIASGAGGSAGMWQISESLQNSSGEGIFSLIHS